MPNEPVGPCSIAVWPPHSAISNSLIAHIRKRTQEVTGLMLHQSEVTQIWNTLRSLTCALVAIIFYFLQMYPIVCFLYRYHHLICKEMHLFQFSSIFVFLLTGWGCSPRRTYCDISTIWHLKVTNMYNNSPLKYILFYFSFHHKTGNLIIVVKCAYEKVENVSYVCCCIFWSVTKCAFFTPVTWHLHVWCENTY